MKFSFIEKHRSEHSVMKMCHILGVSRSGYFKWRTHQPSPQEQRKNQIQDRIAYHYHDSGRVYGSPKITHLLLKEGFTISERTVGVYMQELGLRSCVSKTARVTTTNATHDHRVSPNRLNQEFKASAPNKVWVADITYIPCREERLYLACVLDLYTREIVGWQVKTHMETALVLEALEKAYEAKQPAPGLLHHSDRGTQYASHIYRKQLAHYGMERSMSRAGNCYDNACAESFFSLVKKELIREKRFKTKKEAYTEIFRYIEFFYNRKRIHGSIGYVSPVKFAQQYEENSSV